MPADFIVADSGTDYFVVCDQDGKYLAKDTHSGGYPWWADSFRLAEKFTLTERDLTYIRSCNDPEKRLYILRIKLATQITLEEYENECGSAVRAGALAKLSDVEKRALGLMK